MAGTCEGRGEDQVETRQVRLCEFAAWLGLREDSAEY